MSEENSIVNNNQTISSESDRVQVDDDTQSVDTQRSTTSITNKSPEVQQIKGSIKEWLAIDNEIEKCNLKISEIKKGKLAELQKEKKELEKKKEDMTGNIVEFMEEHDVPFFNTPNDKIELKESTRTKALSKGSMFDLLNRYFKNDATKATDAVNFINENREVVTQSKLRRKKNKK
jgi:hypothetical protein